MPAAPAGLKMAGLLKTKCGILFALYITYILTVLTVPLGFPQGIAPRIPHAHFIDVRITTYVF